MLYDKIVTEAVAGSITTIDNKMSLPVTVHYFPESGKAGDALTGMFMQHLKILKMCQSCTMKTKLDRPIIFDCVSVFLFVRLILILMKFDLNSKHWIMSAYILL